MSRYGPPGGPYPAEPDEPYRRPADPWGHAQDSPGHTQDSWGDLTVPQPGYREPQPGYPAAGYHRTPHPSTGYGRQQPDWEQPPRQPPRRGNRGMVVLAVILLLLVAGGVGVALYVVSGDERDPAAGGTTPGVDATGRPAEESAEESAEPGPDPGSTRDNVGLSAAVAGPDDCLVNDGTASEPEMRIVPCDTDEDADVYRVLNRIDERVESTERAQQECADTEGYEHHYYFVSDDGEDSDETSFVLCMAER